MKKESLLQRARSGLLNPIVSALNSVEEIIQSSDQDREKLLDALISLFVLVLKADGHVSEAEFQAVRRALRDEHGEAAVKKLQEKVDADALPNVKDACAALGDMPPKDREMLLHSLFIAGYSDNQYGLPEQKVLRKIATELSIDDATYDRLQQESLEEHNRRMRLVRSGTGLLAAGAVLAMFIVTATFLKAVLFGLILAYFFLPVAQRLSRSFINNGFAAKCYSALGLLFAPFRLIIRGVQFLFRRKDGEEKIPKPDPEAEIRATIGRACNATVLGVMLSVVLVIVSFTLVTLSYKPAELPQADALREKAAGFVEGFSTWKVIGQHAERLAVLLRDDAALEKFGKSLVGDSSFYKGYDGGIYGVYTTKHSQKTNKPQSGEKIELKKDGTWHRKNNTKNSDQTTDVRGKFSINEGRITFKTETGQTDSSGEFVSGKIIIDERTTFEKNTKGIPPSESDEASPFDSYMALFGTAVGILGAIGNFLLNALLALFFFSFFLKKMALFHHEHQEQKQEGDYLVQSLFQTSWLPTTSEETLRSAAEVINEVFYKLKTWVRGYLWIIIIETIVYITIFLLLGVPYAIILGGIAGLTVLLPFIGPLISIILTMGVCLIAGQANMSLLLAIGGVYAIMNMIVEQLFLYPAFVGEALGLNILETMIVVLLGGLFAGLAGVIFAVPAASVLKFIIPRLYQSLFQKEELVLPEAASAK